MVFVVVLVILQLSTGNLSSAFIIFTLESEANEDPPEFTLTCQSRGGPVTEVEWRRNGVRVEEDSNHMTSQIIVDTSRNTVYNNTLRVRGREAGKYMCYITSIRYGAVQGTTETTFSDEKTLQSRFRIVFIEVVSSNHKQVLRIFATGKSQCYLQDTYQYFVGVEIQRNNQHWALFEKNRCASGIACACKRVLLLQLSSAAAEHVFSILSRILLDRLYRTFCHCTVK